MKHLVRLNAKGKLKHDGPRRASMMDWSRYFAQGCGRGEIAVFLRDARKEKLMFGKCGPNLASIRSVFTHRLRDIFPNT